MHNAEPVRHSMHAPHEGLNPHEGDGPSLSRRGLFVTGTDTGAGKTVLSASLLAAMSAAGERVLAHKPVVTGLDEPESDWPADDALLAGLCDIPREQVAPLRYGPAVSPHLAQQLAKERIDRRRIVESAASAAARASEMGATLVVEGVGGLLVPLTEDLSVRDLAVDMGLPLLIAARPGLGTISHTLLTIESARTAGLSVVAVVLTPWPADPPPIARSNRETIARLGEVEVATLPCAGGPGATELAAAGSSLPWQRWLRPAAAG